MSLFRKNHHYADYAEALAAGRESGWPGVCASIPEAAKLAVVCADTLTAIPGAYFDPRLVWGGAVVTDLTADELLRFCAAPDIRALASLQSLA